MTKRSLFLLFLLSACGDDALPATDAGGTDARTPDVGRVDSGEDRQDSGAEDSGSDSGTPTDTGTAPDTNTPVDAGSPDVSGPCQPFTAVGCEPGSWCKPGDNDVSMGVCEAHGAQDPGDVCITNIDCVSGAVCGERPEGGICDQTCDPESPQGSVSNPCMSGTRCSNLRDSETGDTIALGVCVPSCDYDADVPCRDASLTCEPSELVSGEVDVCLGGVVNLPVQGDCGLAGVPHGQLCGPNQICLDRAELRPGNVCFAVCRANVGALNRDGHPDCDPEQVCTQFAVGLGVCL